MSYNISTIKSEIYGTHGTMIRSLKNHSAELNCGLGLQRGGPAVATCMFTLFNVER